MRRTYITKTTIAIIIGVLTITSCEMIETEGNGEVTSKRINIGEFDNIEITGIMNVYLGQSISHKLEVETDENLHHIVNVEVLGNTLYVSTNGDEDWNATKLDVIIKAPDLSKIKLDGVMALYSEGIMRIDTLDVEKANTGLLQLEVELDDLTISSSDVGDIELIGEADHLTLNNTMTGKIQAYNFTANHVDLIHNGTGDVEIHAVQSAEVVILGVGNVYCKGNPPSVDKSGDGTGRFFLTE